MKIAVVSDLHAWTAPPADAGYILDAKKEGQPAETPLEALVKLVPRLGLTADALLCPGDLAHQADPDAMKYAWRRLNDLRGLLQAEVLIGTAGNHDMDSRFGSNNHDPRQLLQTLLPPFPVSDGTDFDRYWAKHFAFFTQGQIRVVVLNSSAFHGYVSPGADPEHNHGRIDEAVIGWLRQALDAESPCELNVCLVHHHPQRYGVAHPDDISEMQGAQDLLDICESGKYGPWLIIHGHRHWPWLTYAAGGSSSPAIFSAGSLSGTTFRLPVRNQFYLLEVNTPSNALLGLEMAGTFRAWDWSPLGSWVQAGRASGLPAAGGFGSRTSVPEVARRILEVLDGLAEPYQTWREVEAADSLLRYVLPRDRDHALTLLEARRQARFEMDDEHGEIQLMRQ